MSLDESMLDVHYPGWREVVRQDTFSLWLKHQRRMLRNLSHSQSYADASQVLDEYALWKLEWDGVAPHWPSVHGQHAIAA